MSYVAKRFTKPQSNDTVISDNPVVQTIYGPVRGQTKNGVTTFKGVPFAAPPVGRLRFLPPHPHKGWKKPLDCTRFRDSAIQASEVDPLITRSEDCLYLNIWAPEGAEGQKLPVLVFIHGGGYSEGSPAKMMFDGTRFAQDGIIQVNVTYRLNALGFLSFAELEEKYGVLGNMGTMDQVAALKWVQQNIAEFGGDPDCVTVSGESAGAFSVSNMIVSPMAKGLFQRAIMESGNLLGQAIVAPLADGNRKLALLTSQAYMASLGAHNIRDMQRIDPRKIARGCPFQDNMISLPDYNFWPVFDGNIIPENPYQALVDGNINGVDILAGYNTDEGSIFIPNDTDEESYMLLAGKIFIEDGYDVIQQYPVDAKHTATNRARHLVEMGLRMGCDIFADELSQQGHNVWFYNFDYSLPVLERVGLGAMHALELIYVFDTAPRILVRDEQHHAFKEDVHGRWLNFIKTGNPNDGNFSGTPWPQYTKEKKESLILNVETRTAPAPGHEDVAFYRHLLWGGE